MANNIKDLQEFIRDASALLPNETEAEKKRVAEFNNLLAAIDRANALLADKNCKNKDEKEARLIDTATKDANTLIFTLFQLDKLSDEKGKEIEKRYRALDPYTETIKVAKVFYEAREEHRQKLIDDMNKITDEEQDLSVFLGVLSGKTKKEAKELVEKYAKGDVASAAGVPKEK